MAATCVTASLSSLIFVALFVLTPQSAFFFNLHNLFIIPIFIVFMWCSTSASKPFFIKYYSTTLKTILKSHWGTFVSWWQTDAFYKMVHVAAEDGYTCFYFDFSVDASVQCQDPQPRIQAFSMMMCWSSSRGLGSSPVLFLSRSVHLFHLFLPVSATRVSLSFFCSSSYILPSVSLRSLCPISSLSPSFLLHSLCLLKVLNKQTNKQRVSRVSYL